MRIQDAVLKTMVNHAREQRPLECCGLLAGVESIDWIRLCTNAENSSSRFSIPPTELFAFFREIREMKTSFLGIYHSHPDSTSSPSTRDIREFHYPDVSYWIISFKNEQAVVRCFEWQEDCFRKVDYHILNREKRLSVEGGRL